MPDLDMLMRGAEEVLPEGQLEKQLAEGEPLRVKLGHRSDRARHPPGPCRRAQSSPSSRRPGHTVVLIIGDFTALVGDPSGRDTTRPVLTPEQIEANAQTFQDQAFKVLDRERTEVRHNSEWLDMPVQDLFRLLGKTTVARLLEREDFTKRMRADQPISALELIYPVLQGYDSVAIRADVELGDRPEVQPAVRQGHPARLRRAAAVGHDHADPARAPTASRK